MKKYFLIVVSIVVAGLLLNACSARGKLIGKWTNWSDGSIYFFGESIIEFQSDGLVKDHDSGETGKWSVIDGGNLKIEKDKSDRTYTFTYEIKGNMLTIVDEDGDKSVYQKSK